MQTRRVKQEQKLQKLDSIDRKILSNCAWGGGGLLPENLGGGVWRTSGLNPYPGLQNRRYIFAFCRRARRREQSTRRTRSAGHALTLCQTKMCDLTPG